MFQLFFLVNQYNKIIVLTKMSIDFVRTYHSPINNSSSKQMHAFTRANRFQSSRKSQCKKQFYQTKRGALDKRSASFGYGNKLSFENRQGIPQPGKYTRTDEFTLNKIKQRGNKFGNEDNRSLLSNPKELRQFPGPGAYVSINEKHKTGFGTQFSNYKFSMRGKYEDPLSRHGNELGPDHYPIDSPISARGSYYNTKYQNSFCPKVGKDSRFPSQKVESPGPGKYQGNEKINLNGTGTYFDSKFKTTKANSFSRETRPSPAKAKQAPDPGTYWTFSEFAIRNKTLSRQL